tara:strand:+ start:99 stop:317 length:219 start_codon:yes stop_codon:yes gene_type:complete
MLYNDTFVKSTLTTFDRVGGKDVKSKEINEFIAKSFHAVKTKENEKNLAAEMDKITISIDYCLQKIIFIWED